MNSEACQMEFSQFSLIDQILLITKRFVIFWLLVHDLQPSSLRRSWHLLPSSPARRRNASLSFSFQEMKGVLVYSHCQFPVGLEGSHGRHSKPKDSLSFVSSTCVRLGLMSIASPQLWD